MPRGRSGEGVQTIPLARAAALGALQGPTELLPVSSSGHLALVPWLLGWEWADADGDLRKAFEVMLHAGTAVALLIALPDELVPRTVQQCVVRALSVAPAALVGYLFERPIERRLGTPRTVAVGLIGGGLALALSDRAPETRNHDEAKVQDALWLGLAQACALFPGVSRGGATLAAARLRGFRRADAQALSRELALPVIAGAALLKGVRLQASGLPRRGRASFMVGALVSFASTLAARPLLRFAGADRPLASFAAYRIALATVVFVRLRTLRRGSPSSRTVPHVT